MDDVKEVNKDPETVITCVLIATLAETVTDSEEAVEEGLEVVGGGVVEDGLEVEIVSNALELVAADEGGELVEETTLEEVVLTVALLVAPLDEDEAVAEGVPDELSNTPVTTDWRAEDKLMRATFGASRLKICESNQLACDTAMNRARMERSRN